MSRSGRADDRWDPVWSGSSYSRPALRAARARSKVAAVAALGLDLDGRHRVLDLACGSGEVLIEVAERAPRSTRWVGCDLSPLAAALARSSFERCGLDAQALTADAVALPFRPESFDVVLSFMALHHLDRPDQALAEVERVLAGEGRLFVVVPGRYSLASLVNVVRRAAGLWPYDSRRYTAGSLVALLGSRFEVEACRPWHLGFDRPVSAAADRALGTVLPFWGRYLVARCRKRSRY